MFNDFLVLGKQYGMHVVWHRQKELGMDLHRVKNKTLKENRKLDFQKYIWASKKFLKPNNIHKKKPQQINSKPQDLNKWSAVF